jgi:hypothetical protein
MNKRKRKITRRLSAIFSEAAQRIVVPPFAHVEAGKTAYFACYAISFTIYKHFGLSYLRAEDKVLKYYEAVMIGHDDHMSSGWFGTPISILNQEARIMSLLLAAEFYGDKKITITIE